MSDKKKRSTLGVDISVGVLAAVVICTIAFFVSAHFVNLANGATQVVSDGQNLFAPGRLLHDRALAGMVVSFLALVGIGYLHSYRKSIPHALLVSGIFALLALVAVAFAANTWQVYRSFGLF